MTPKVIRLYILETIDLATGATLDGANPVYTSWAEAITAKAAMKRSYTAQGRPWLDVRITTRMTNDAHLHIDPDIVNELTPEGGTTVTTDTRQPNTTNPLSLEDENPPTIVFEQLSLIHREAGKGILNVNEAEIAARVLKCAALVAYLRGMSDRAYALLIMQWDQWNYARKLEAAALAAEADADDERARAEMNAARASERRACGAI